MQVFRNLEQPESSDIRTLPGYPSLTIEQKQALHDLYHNCFEAYQGRGLSVASGMAYQVVKQRLAQALDEATIGEEAKPASLALPNVVDKDDDAIADALVQAILQLFQEPEAEEKGDAEAPTVGDEMSAVSEHLHAFSQAIEEKVTAQTPQQIAQTFGYAPVPQAPGVLVHGPSSSLLQLGQNNSWTHILPGQAPITGTDPFDLHRRLATAHRHKGCGAEDCGPGSRNHNN